MGWCSAFGPQIHEGCDHAMVAGTDACSCTECGSDCAGRFPGCATVWAAGPRLVSVTKARHVAGNLLPTLTSDDRTEASVPVPVIVPPPSVIDQAEVHALRVDMQLLMWKFDQLRQATSANEQLARSVEAAAQALPTQVAAAVAAVMEEVSANAASVSAASVSDVDERFTWLVEAVSERFVSLGNEIARIQRQLSDLAVGDPRTTNRAPR